VGIFSFTRIPAFQKNLHLANCLSAVILFRAVLRLALVYNGASRSTALRIDPMLSIRPAAADDAALLSAMILELAVFEHLEHEFSMTAEAIVRDGFGARPKFRAVIAHWDGEPVGYAIFFDFYSSFQGRAGLFLDDLFVRPAFRKRGIGTALIKHVAGIAWKEKYFCMRWEVLDWNKPAIDFYNNLGASFLEEWKPVILIGDALEAAAKGAL
jgi:GNAT superfamily N-acetyltransferase